MINQHQKGLLKLALPLILGNLSQMMLNLVDSAMVGQLGYQYLAAASLVNNIIGFPFVIILGFTAAISPLVAELKGANRINECGVLLNNAFFLNLIVSGLIVMLLFLCGGVIHHLKQDEEVAQLAHPYLNWMLWSIIPMTAFLSIKQFCDGLNHTRIPLLLSLFSILLNAFLNYLFIYGNFGFPEYALKGAGIATFITRTIIAVILAIYVLRHIKYRKYQIKIGKLKNDIVHKIARIAVPSAWQYTSEIGAFAVLGIMVGWFGAIQQAAHQVSLSVAALTFMVSVGMSTAGSIKVGEAFGMKDIALARNTGIYVLKFAGIYGCICAVLFILFRNQIPLIFAEEKQVIDLAAILFLFAAAFQLGDSLQAVGIGILRGFQDVKIPTLYTTLSYWFIGIPVGFLLGVVLQWGVTGIWTGFISCLSIMAVLLCFRFLSITRLKGFDSSQ